MMGRWLVPSDAPLGSDPQPVVVLSYKFWQRYYLGDPHVIGRTIRLVVPARCCRECSTKHRLAAAGRADQS